MKTGSIFTPDGLNKDMTALEDFYGSQGYIDVQRGQSLSADHVPNVDTGTMDLEFHVDEGQKVHVEQINIRGNIKTKDKVIRRELAIAPGEVFDMVRVKTSKQRLEGLDYFDKVDLQPEPMDPPIPGRKNLNVNVEEKDTGKFTLGAGINSDAGLVGFAEISQGNFDLFHPPYFTGGGQKVRLLIQLGTERQDYELAFIEPWFLNRKLALGVYLYRHQMDYESPNNIYNETRTGTRLSLTRALGSDFLIGSVSYTVEDVGIRLNNGWHDTQEGRDPVPPGMASRVNQAKCAKRHFGPDRRPFFQRLGASLAYDTRNSNKLPNHGQRTEIDPEFDLGDTTYYKVEAKTEWYFPGLFKGHVLEVMGRAGIADSLSGGDVPIYDRYYLGGLYSLRGFKFRNIGPRDPAYGHQSQHARRTNWRRQLLVRLAGIQHSDPRKGSGPSVRSRCSMMPARWARAYSFSGNFDDDYGIGLRLDIRTSARCGWTTAFPSRMINTTAPPASSSSESVTHADFKMTPWTKTNSVFEDNSRRTRRRGLAGRVCHGCRGADGGDAGRPAALFRGQPGAGGFSGAIHRPRTRFPISDFAGRGAICPSQNNRARRFFGAGSADAVCRRGQQRADSGAEELPGKINYLIGNEPARLADRRADIRQGAGCGHLFRRQFDLLRQPAAARIRFHHRARCESRCHRDPF